MWFRHGARTAQAAAALISMDLCSSLNEGIELADKIARWVSGYPLPNVPSRSLAHFSQAMPILPRSVHRFIEQLDSGSLCDEAVYVVSNQLSVSSYICHDAGAAAKHRFNQRQRHSLISRWKYQRMMATPQFLNVVNETGEADVREL